MKQGWEIKKLSEICVSSNGLWKGKNPPFTTIAVLRSTNFTKDCKIKLDDVAYIEVEEKSFAKRRLQKNDIVVERSGGGPNQPVGRVLLFDIEDENYSFCNFTSALRVLDTTIVSPIYLHRYLTYFYLSGQTINIQSNTIGLRNLDYTKYLEISIPVPPIAEQQRIVEILDREFEKIDALKANAERSLQQAKDLFQSALKQELKPKEGWVTVSLNDLYDVRDGTHDSPKYTQQGYPFVTSKNLKDGKIDMSDVKYISKEDYDKINERSKVDVGDILFAMIGSNLGHPALVVDEPNYAIKNVALFKVPSSQSSRLLLYLLSSDLIMDKINKEKSGSSQPFVSLKYLRTFKVSIPMEYEQQEELALRIERLDRISKRLQSKYINIIALCDDMKQALLRQAFNGEL